MASPPAPPTSDDTPYRVLARKYRPGDFASLIGQDAVVKTLANAIASNRLAQAWLLTGVRGVGKTSTARIIARALNCIGPDGTGGPTANPCGQCSNCVAIAAGEHIDVTEIDAASNTGVDNIREIIESVRYAPVAARYKIYIIDEVHMLSKGAFNALLKTLEEPPPHVKFIFATTEVQKLPATILSRCQRFDLKRVPVDLLIAHFARVVEAEGLHADAEALQLIARAAEGSVRDGLSILDQAIAHAGDGHVAADIVRDMLGLADRGELGGLMAAILAADVPAVVARLDAAHAAGTEPRALVDGLLDLVHTTTRAKLAGSTDPTLAEAERAAIDGWAEGLSFPALHQLWQLLLKGHADVVQAPVPQQAAEMAILRCVHAAGLPDPGRLAALLQGAPAPDLPTPATPAAAPAGASAQSAQAVPAAPSTPDAALPADAAAFVALFEMREPMLAHHLHDDVAIAFRGPRDIYLGHGAALPPGFAADVRRCLAEWLGGDWTVASGPPDAGARSLRQIADDAAADARAKAQADPRVQALLAAFPGSALIEPKAPRDAVPPLLRSARQ